MDPVVFDDVLILTGPTASGKSAVGIILAEQLGAEIVAMDSMTLYRGMDVGTAKPSAADRQRVKHHLIDALDPWESASVAWWLERAASICHNAQERGRRILFVGGTPLYLKGLLRGIFSGPAADHGLRDALESRSVATLYAQLLEVDPAAAARIHTNDRRRIIRALEVQLLTGQPISRQQQEFQKPRPRRLPPVWLELPRTDLRERINRRVDAMIATGFLAEVQALRILAKPLSKEASQALGYKEILAYLAGERDWPTTVELTKTHSRQFAKRQLTWFRHLEECVRLEIAKDDTAEQIATRVLERWPGVSTQ